MGRNVSPQLISMIATPKTAIAHNIRITRIGTPGRSHTLDHREPEEFHILLAIGYLRQPTGSAGSVLIWLSLRLLRGVLCDLYSLHVSQQNLTAKNTRKRRKVRKEYQIRTPSGLP
jgi:hypothetical protein